MMKIKYLMNKTLKIFKKKLLLLITPVKVKENIQFQFYNHWHTNEKIYCNQSFQKIFKKKINFFINFEIGKL